MFALSINMKYLIIHQSVDIVWYIPELYGLIHRIHLGLHTISSTHKLCDLCYITCLLRFSLPICETVIQ